MTPHGLRWQHIRKGRRPDYGHKTTDHERHGIAAACTAARTKTRDRVCLSAKESLFRFEVEHNFVRRVRAASRQGLCAVLIDLLTPVHLAFALVYGTEASGLPCRPLSNDSVPLVVRGVAYHTAAAAQAAARQKQRVATASHRQAASTRAEGEFVDKGRHWRGIFSWGQCGSRDRL